MSIRQTPKAVRRCSKAIQLPGALTDVGVVSSAPRPNSVGGKHWMNACYIGDTDFMPRSTRVHPTTQQKYVEWANLFRVQDKDGNFIFVECTGHVGRQRVFFPQTLIDKCDEIRRRWLCKRYHGISSQQQVATEVALW